MYRTHSHLHKRQSGIYSYRITVPPNLRETIGKREIHVSLHTKDYSKAVERIKVVSLQVERQLIQAKRQIGLAMAEVTLVELEDLAEKWLRKLLDKSAEWITTGEARTPEDVASEIRCMEVVKGDLERALKANNPGAIIPFVRDTLEAEGLNINKDSKEFRMAAHSFTRTYIQYLGIRIAHLNGEWPELPNYHRITPRSPTTTVPLAAKTTSQSLTMKALCDQYLASPDMRHIKPATVKSYKTTFSLLLQILGESTPIATINRETCRNARDLISQLPANYSKLYPGKSIRDIVAIAKEQELPTMTERNANKYIINLAALFNWAEKEEYLSKNPAVELTLKISSLAKEAKNPFTLEQLQHIFNAPLYTGCINDDNGYNKPGPNRPRRGRFWVPLISLYSAMRLNEICQLLIEDIQQEDGVDFISVKEDLKKGKQLKTKASNRKIPIHPMLKQLGFMQYVDQMRQQKEVRLFPELKKSGDRTYSHEASKWFSRFLINAGVKTDKTSYHSFRHTFRDAMRQAELSPGIVAALGGWDDKEGVSSTYGQGYKMSKLYEAMEKIQHEDLDLSHLYIDPKQENL